MAMLSGEAPIDRPHGRSGKEVGRADIMHIRQVADITHMLLSWPFRCPRVSRVGARKGKDKKQLC